MLLHVPHVGGAVVRAGGEVVSERTELDIPNRELVPVVNHKTGSCLHRPAANRGILRARDYKLVIDRDRNTVDGPRVPNKFKLCFILDHLLLFLFWPQVKCQSATVKLVNDVVLLALGAHVQAFAAELVRVELHLETLGRVDSVLLVEVVGLLVTQVQTSK